MSKNLWYAVEFSSAIPPGVGDANATNPRSLTILGRELVLYRTSDGQIHAMNASGGGALIMFTVPLGANPPTVEDESEPSVTLDRQIAGESDER